jgi:hypothetical protein
VRRARVRNAVLGAALVVLAATLTFTVTSDSPKHIRVAIRPSTTSRTPNVATVTLQYVDRSKPPPLRIGAGGHSVDISTVLGCWMHRNRGICADGVVDPARFELVLNGARSVTVTSPIDAQIHLHWSNPAPPHGPHELPAFPSDRRLLSARRLGTRHWQVEVPQFSGAIAVYLDVTTAPNDRIEHGSAYYGFELRSI